MLKDSIQKLLGQVREMNAANAEELEALRIIGKETKKR